MEGNWRWVLIGAFAPVAWGSTYFVTRTFLPTEPLWGALIRALPAGVVLLIAARRLPSGVWWWKSLVLSVLNVGAFFVLVYEAAQLLPSSLASTIMAAAPIALALIGWLLIHERPSGVRLISAVVGLGGVGLMLLGGHEQVHWGGVVASIAAMTASSFGFILGKRWNPEVGVLASTAWQLVLGGTLLTPVAILVEGSPPAVGPTGVVAYAYLTIVATGAAYLAWFAALDHLRADTTGLLGLLNPVAGILLGLLLADEALNGRQILGLATVLAAIAAPLIVHSIRNSAPRSHHGDRHLR